MKWLVCVLFYCFLPLHTQAKEIRVLILGDSLTEGYGVAKEKSFPVRLQEKIRADGLKNVEVIAAGVSGATSASGPVRFKWYLKNPPQILILALGGNDLLRGLNPQATKANLEKTIQMAKSQKIKVILAGMKVPPNYGSQYVRDFEKVYMDLAKKEKVVLIPFLLEGVGGHSHLNLEDGIHPNELGHEIIAQTVYKFLKPLL